MSNNLPVRRQEVEIVGKAAPHALGLGPRNFGELESFAKLVHESGMFKDIKSAAAAVVKMAAGAELGLTPIASLRSLHVFEGKVEMGAHLILGLCKQAGYSVKVLQTDQYAAMLEWYDPQGNLCGPPVGFTYKEAENAGLTRKFNWKAYAADMLWARAISRGARRYCPEVTHGVYVEGEISQAPPIDHPPARSHQQQPTPQPTIEPAHHDAVEAEIVESTASAAPPADEKRERFMRKLHAIGKDLGLSHEELRQLIGLDSLKDATGDLLEWSCSLLSCEDVERLRSVWNRMPMAHRKQLAALKDWGRAHLPQGEPS